MLRRIKKEDEIEILQLKKEVHGEVSECLDYLPQYSSCVCQEGKIVAYLLTLHSTYAGGIHICDLVRTRFSSIDAREMLLDFVNKFGKDSNKFFITATLLSGSQKFIQQVELYGLNPVIVDRNDSEMKVVFCSFSPVQ